MFNQIETTALPPSSPPPPRKPTWRKRVMLWLVDNLTPCYVVKRTYIGTIFHVTEYSKDAWLRSYAGSMFWGEKNPQTLITWKWNAKRIAKSEQWYRADCYEYAIERVED